MKVGYTILALFLAIIANAQVNLTSLTVTNVPKFSNPKLIYNIGLTNDNFSRGYIYSYLSKNNTLSADDILLGAQRIIKSNFDDNKVKTIDYAMPSSVTIDKYYVIVKVDITGGGEYVFSTNSSYCINLTNNSGNCDPIVIPVEKPDLRIDRDMTYITSECSDCSFSLGGLGSKKHLLSKEGGIINLQAIYVANSTQGNAGSSTLDFYLSNDTSLSTDDYKFNGSITIPQLPANSFYSASKSFFGNDIPSNKAYGNYYILMVLDKQNLIDESNETNNVTAVPIRYRQNVFGREASGKSSVEKYNFKVYNLSGNEILNENATSIEDENLHFEKLDKGIYIVKYADGTFKKIVK